MAANEIISVFCFGQEIGRIGYDADQHRSSFQYHPDFLQSNRYTHLFPQTGILKRVPQVQIFSQFNSETFRGLPPMIADSLPDVFGNIIFKKWLETSDKHFSQISVIEQLAYVADRGMGALEFRPSKELPQTSSIDLTEIIAVLKEVLNSKQALQETGLNHDALLNIFKIGTSAGGARPKILISEHKQTGEIIPGDLNYSSEYHHYLVKLHLEDEIGYSREVIEYCYYLTATHLGITMMPSKLIDKKHFATLRFDRQNGMKKHILTATGLTGWDFQSPKDSSYENLFELALFLKVPHRDVEELFKRMVFNIVFFNADDHLKNHSFIYDEKADRWNLSPAYDLTYSLNPLMNYTKTSRALSVNGKRVDIELKDVLTIAETYTIKNARNVVKEIQDSISIWNEKAQELDMPSNIIQSIQKDFVRLN
jgi:serine/threonine-protein kinase HipA